MITPEVRELNYCGLHVKVEIIEDDFKVVDVSIRDKNDLLFYLESDSSLCEEVYRIIYNRIRKEPENVRGTDAKSDEE